MENTTEPILSQRDQHWIGAGKEEEKIQTGRKKFHKNTEWELCVALALTESLEKRQIGKSRAWRKLG